MKYTRKEISTPIGHLQTGKIRFYDNDDFSETPWIGKVEGETYGVLLNHALMFLPYSSWGAIIPVNSGSLNPLSIVESGIIELHNEAYDAYVEHGVIDNEGSWIEQEDEVA